MADKPIQWVYVAGSECAYCKEGLCGRLNQLMEEGNSIRASARLMEEECERKWKAETIRELFMNMLGGNPPSAHRAKGTGQNNWFTPEKYIHAARIVLGEIDLDPATCEEGQRRIKAKNYFTEDDDGLAHEWSGRVWLNPPYSQPHIRDFVHKLCTEFESKRVSQAIMLTHAYTDTAWFHEAEALAKYLCFTKGRIGFEEDDGHIAAPTQGQCFFYFGEDGERFYEVFSGFGFVR